MTAASIQDARIADAVNGVYRACLAEALEVTSAGERGIELSVKEVADRFARAALRGLEHGYLGGPAAVPAEPEPEPAPLKIVGIERPVAIAARAAIQMLTGGEIVDVKDLPNGELIGLTTGGAVRITTNIFRTRYEVGKAVWE